MQDNSPSEIGQRASTQPSGASATVASVLLCHFCKIFAVVGLALVVYIGHSALAVWETYKGLSVAVTTRQKLVSANRLGPLDFSSRNRTAVTLKNQPTPIIGYFLAAEDDFLVLIDAPNENGRLYNYFVPWENVQSIQIDTTEILGKK